MQNKKKIIKSSKLYFQVQLHINFVIYSSDIHRKRFFFFFSLLHQWNTHCIFSWSRVYKKSIAITSNKLRGLSPLRYTERERCAHSATLVSLPRANRRFSLSLFRIHVTIARKFSRFWSIFFSYSSARDVN